MTLDAASPFGVYVHIPFCAARCDYCAFATWDDRPELITPYLDALRGEVHQAVAGGLPPATSVFVGGGTPSLVDPHALTAVLGELRLATGAEVTIECNPDSLDSQKVDAYVACGVTRLSLGVQSMDPAVLHMLGRTHTVANVTRAVTLARAGGISELNIDLIYGAHAETMTQWERTVREVVELDVEHVSAYGLTVEAGTVLADDGARHPDDDDQADKYLLVDEILSDADYRWYEVSNWARPGHRCRHNMLYWTMGEYQGFGCAAHSHRGGRRSWNVRTPERYLTLRRNGSSVEAAGECLGASARDLECLQLALRTSIGVPSTAFSPHDLEVLGELVELEGDRIVLTRRGRLLANEVALRLRHDAALPAIGSPSRRER